MKTVKSQELYSVDLVQEKKYIRLFFNLDFKERIDPLLLNPSRNLMALLRMAEFGLNLKNGKLIKCRECAIPRSRRENLL